MYYFYYTTSPFTTRYLPSTYWLDLTLHDILNQESTLAGNWRRVSPVMRVTNNAVWSMALLPVTLSLHIHGDLLELAQSAGHIDAFVQFQPFNFESKTMARVNSLLESRLPEMTAYTGWQEVAGESEMQLTAVQLARGIRRQTVMELLLKHAEKTQGPTLRELRGLGYNVKSFWIDNSILIKQAPLYLLTMLVQLAQSEDGKDIMSLSPNRIVARIPPMSRMTVGGLYHGRSLFETVDLSEDYVPWNLRLIKADKVWEHSKGKGVTVANIDTGVDFIHPRLKGKYRGIDSALKTVKHEYNWFDPEGLAILPHDCHGHGTHTMGTMVGDGIGVAPEAKWIAAQGCDSEGCSQERLLASAQWVMCPTDSNGENARCEFGADIVNNSWGGEITDDASMTWFSSAVKAWLAGGIFPIFAQGNSGPACGTVGTPGDLEDVIGVGAVDQFGSLTVFSSRGPGGSRLGHAQFKPDYVAPGQAIVSCKPGGELIAMSGTSMAAPHVAGIAALLLSMKGDLKFDELRTLITKTINTSALKEPQMGQQACYGKRWDHFPNYHYGFGLVDTEAAAKALQA